jgi:hypothetical protein
MLKKRNRKRTGGWEVEVGQKYKNGKKKKEKKLVNEKKQLM